MKIQSRKVNFKKANKNKLSGLLEFPVHSEPKATIIISHCFTCTKQTITTARLSRGLAQLGFAVLRFDFTGLGESEGVFSDTHFRSMISDIECAAQFLLSNYNGVAILIGHSMGGTACLAASQNMHSALAGIQKIITLASPAEPAHVLHHFGSVLENLKQGEDAFIQVAGKKYPVKPAFIEDVMSYDMNRQMQQCNIPIMAVQAGNDALVEASAAKKILSYTHAEKKLCRIDGADHLFSDRKHSALLLSQVESWLTGFKRYK